MHARLLVLLTILGLALTACGGDSGPTDDALADSPSGATAESDDAGAQGGAVALLSLFDEAAELALAEATDDFAPAADGTAVALGDTIRTDATGFAQLDFTDGSLARLDSATTLTVVALGTVATPEVELDLDVGRVWNSVRDLEDGSYEVTTDVGTAAVRGTTFLVWVREDGSTLVAVYDGEVVFTTTDGEEYVLGPGDTLEIGPEGTTDGPGPVPDALTTDPFVLRNQAIDETGQDPGPGGDQLAEALAGDYRVTYTMTTPPEVDTQIAPYDDGSEPYVRIHEDAWAGLPLEVGGSGEVVWTIGGDGLVVADVPPRVTTLVATGPASFQAGYERQDFGPLEACDDQPNIRTSLTTIEVDQDAGQVVAFTGRHVEGSYVPDTETCLNLRHTTVWELTAERIGPPDEARLEEYRG